MNKKLYNSTGPYFFTFWRVILIDLDLGQVEIYGDKQSLFSVELWPVATVNLHISYTASDAKLNFRPFIPEKKFPATDHWWRVHKIFNKKTWELSYMIAKLRNCTNSVNTQQKFSLTSRISAGEIISCPPFTWKPPSISWTKLFFSSAD